MWEKKLTAPLVVSWLFYMVRPMGRFLLLREARSSIDSCWCWWLKAVSVGFPYRLSPVHYNLVRLTVLLARIHVWQIVAMFSRTWAHTDLRSLSDAFFCYRFWQLASLLLLLHYFYLWVHTLMYVEASLIYLFSNLATPCSSMPVLFSAVLWLPPRKLFDDHLSWGDPLPLNYFHYLRVVH